MQKKGASMKDFKDLIKPGILEEFDYRDITCKNCTHIFRTKSVLGCCPICKYFNTAKWFDELENTLKDLKSQNIAILQKLSKNLMVLAEKVTDMSIMENVLRIEKNITKLSAEWGKSTSYLLWLMDVESFVSALYPDAISSDPNNIDDFDKVLNDLLKKGIIDNSTKGGKNDGGK